MKRLYLDTNIVLDYLLDRPPFSLAAKQLFAAAQRKEVKLLVSSLSFTTVHYIASKSLTAAGALAGIYELFELVTVAAIDGQVVAQALRAGLPDFEDAVQLFAALAAQADIIVTRDFKGFAQSPIVIADARMAIDQLSKHLE